MNTSKISVEKASYNGLSSAEAELSRKKHGNNTLTEKKQKSFLSRFLSNLSDPIIKILLAALAVNLIFVFRGGDIFETVGIAVSVFLAAFISTLSEGGSEAAFKRLADECQKSDFRVMRDGAVVKLPISDIAVGDVVLISAGEQIPADGYVISGSIGCDQSSMTGENKEVHKSVSSDLSDSPSSESFVFRGCTVTSGDATLRVERVGDSTFLGGISREVQSDTRESPMKIRLAKLAKQISILGYVAAFFVAIADLFNSIIIDSGFNLAVISMKVHDLAFVGERLLHAFMLGLTVIVVAVPEGLPMMIAVVLSSNIKRMIKDKVLVRKPVGIEAAGSMNILFTDKTGTLTEGKLGVGGIVTGDGRLFDSVSELKGLSPILFERYNDSCRQNTLSSPSVSGALGGNATDKALLDSVLPFSTPSTHTAIKKLPFDSARKFSAVTLQNGITLVKGAPEKLLAHVDTFLDASGKERHFAPFSYDFSRKISSMTSVGGRVILIAYTSGRVSEGSMGTLTLVCAVLLSDALRQEASASVLKLRRAGIGVVMITGDNADTARAIAAKCRILDKKHDLVITSDELSRISDDTLKNLLPRLAVVARALPSDKSRLVRAAQESGLVVGMTGDGINDAPALRLSDIGFAMGNGTQVAKDAGDIIIMDDNLASICRAVLYGRSIFKSIRKFITLQLTMNFSAVGISMICPLFLGIDSPVTVVQMLWINIIMDTLGGLAFAGEAPLESYMDEAPKKRNEPILNGYMINQIVILGSFTVALCLAFLSFPSISSQFRYSPDSIYLMTAFFALFIFASVFNCFNSRTDRLRLFAGLSKNKAFCLIMSAVCAIQIGFVYLGGSVLRTAPLTLRELGLTLLLSLAVIPADLIRKFIAKRFFKNKNNNSF